MKKKLGKRLIIVANRLPFNLIKTGKKLNLKESDGGLVSALRSDFENENGYEFESVLWIGSAEFSEETWLKYSRKRNPRQPFEVYPIFLEKKTYHSFYNGFCNATLWPLFHYFPSFVEFDNGTFKKYEEVNKLFAQEVLSLLQADDILWIHDYQLMLLPGMIRQHRPDATIGFFLHIPFPSFEVFRLLHRPWKDKIINGLLGADVVGFHTHEYVQHFLKTTQMVCGYDHQFRSVFLPDRLVKAEMFPLGIDFQKFQEAPAIPEVMELKDAMKRNFPGKKVIFSVDRLDYTKGVTHRLLGFEKFLEANPQWKENVVFILVVVPSRQVVSKYTERKKLIEEDIGRINGRYSTLQWQPIIYRYSQLSFFELSSMYSAADVALITPLRDGMNLVAKEYVASRGDSGVLILSELAGAANEMGEALLVNPMDEDEVSTAILNALMMPEPVQKSKIHTLQKRLKEYTVIHWMDDFLKQLGETKSLQLSMHSRYLSGKNKASLISYYRDSNKKILFLDYDGTLVPFSVDPKLAVPDETLMAVLSKLCSDDQADIAIISGRDSYSLEKWFGKLPLHLVAEHGASIRLKKGNWKCYLNSDQSWKSLIKPLLELFAQRSPGSFIEEKSHTLVWHYRNVDADLGFIRSRELLDNLHHMIRNSALNIIDGDKVIEVRVSGIDKGVVAQKLLENAHYDCVIAIGDDKTDEDLFRVLSDNAFTIKIGSGYSSAKYFLSGHREVLQLLNNLIEVHEHSKDNVIITP